MPGKKRIVCDFCPADAVFIVDAEPFTNRRAACVDCHSDWLRDAQTGDLKFYSWRIEKMNDLTLSSETESTTISVPDEARDLEMMVARLETAAKYAGVMAKMSLMPDHLRKRKENGVWVDLEPDEIEANCMLVATQALRWGMDPLMIAPESYVVGNKLAFQGKLVAAVINNQAGLRAPLRYELDGVGESLAVTVVGHLKSESEPRRVTLTLSQARTDNDIWADDPEQKLCYSGAIRWARRHAPGTLLGITSGDDLDVVPAVNASVPDPVRIPRVTMADYIDRIREVGTESELRQLGERIKASGLKPGEIESLRSLGKERLAELRKSPPPADPAESTLGRWERTIRTAPLDQLAELLAQADADETLTTEEFQKIEKLVDSIKSSVIADENEAAAAAAGDSE